MRPIITVPDDTLAAPPLHKIEAEAPGSNTRLPALSPAMRHVAQRNALIAGSLFALICVTPLFLVMQSRQEKVSIEDAAPVQQIAEEEKVVALDGTPRTLLKEEQGRTLLSIEGALINRADKRLKVPQLKAEALNAKRKVVREWMIPLSSEDMEPGQRLPFTFSAPFVEQGVVDIAFHLL